MRGHDGGGCARSLHLLRHLGITHLLNATADLLLPDPGAGFQCAPLSNTFLSGVA